MRCFVCNAEMTLMNVVEDGTMPADGFEWRTFMCSACGDVERRLVFSKNIGASEPEPVQVAPPIAEEQLGNEATLGEREDEPAQMAPSIADVQPDNEPTLGEVEDEPAGVKAEPVGVAGGAEIALGDEAVSLAALAKAHEAWLPGYMSKAA